MIETECSNPEEESTRNNIAKINASVREVFTGISWGALADKIYNHIFTAILVSAIAIPTISAIANADSIIEMNRIAAQAQATETISGNKEFSPSLGEETNSKNGRALIIVHKGYGSSIKGKDNEKYNDYLDDLRKREELYLSGGDIVVIVDEVGVWNDDEAKGQHSPQKNIMYLVTQNNSPFPFSQVVYQGNIQNQSFERLLD
jgi:hypothetical protein